MVNLRNFIEKINRETRSQPSVRYNEPMYRHTTFMVGGKADVWVRPGKDIFPAYTAKLLKAAREESIPVFFLGAGANIVVSDNGIRGIVLDTGSYRGIGKREGRKPDKDKQSTGGNREEPVKKTEKDFEALKTQRASTNFSVTVLSGTSVDGLSSRLAERGLSGMEFLAGMPGSVGGAVYMNARCYERQISDVLIETEILDEEFKQVKVPWKEEDFSYKKSPFQGRDILILSASFAVKFSQSVDIRREIATYRRDRTDKGHYRFPSAGSAFKNNRDFGDPTGRIIDQLGLRGLSMGGAQVAPWHGNIIVNTGNATANDIKILVDEIIRRVHKERGIMLESEILFVGDWQ